MSAYWDLVDKVHWEKEQVLRNLIVLDIIKSGVFDKLVSQEQVQVKGGRHTIFALTLVFGVANCDGAAPQSNGVGAMETSSGKAKIQDSNCRESVVNVCRANLEETVERGFRKECTTSIRGPIGELSHRFILLKTGDQSVVVRPPVPVRREKVIELYSKLKVLDCKVGPKEMLGSDLANIPGLVNYMAKHVIITLYSCNPTKRNDDACCGVICTPANVRDVVMQRQPAPRLDLL